MLKLTVIILSAIFIGGIIYWDNKTLPQDMSSSVYTIDKQAPAYDSLTHFSFQTLEGKTYSTQNLDHDTLLIHFWAGWCTTCFAEFPLLIEHVKRQKGKVALLAISIDQKQESYERFMRRLEKEMEQSLKQDNVFWVWDQDRSISLHGFNTVRVPETIIVNKERQMVDKIVGPGIW